MTGFGKIFYPNGDYYEGSVINGKMDSQVKLAKYYSHETRTAYVGCFKDGKRVGKGRIEMEIPTY